MAIGAVVNALVGPRRPSVPACRCGSSSRPCHPRRSSASSTSATSPTRSPRSKRWRSSRRRSPAGRSASRRLLADGYPAYTTTPGWLGYSDEKMVRLAHEAVADGFTQIKLKVGGSLADDIRRLSLAREAVGPDDQDRDRRQPALGRRAGHRLGPAAAGVRHRLDRGADQSRRPARPRHDPPSVVTDPGRHRRAHRQPGDVQAAAAARGHRRHADRRGARGRGEREPRQPAARREVRRAGLPARRWRRPLRGRPAPVHDRLHRDQRDHGGPLHRVRRPPARALRRPGADRRRPLRRTTLAPAPAPR